MTAQSFTPQPVTVLLEGIYDVRTWLLPFINELHGHSQLHCFRFTLNEDGWGVMHYKVGVMVYGDLYYLKYEHIKVGNNCVGGDVAE